MTDTGAVRGVVLAGGDSTRFADGDKAVAALDGTALLGHVLDAHAAATERPPVVVVRDREMAESIDARLAEHSPAFATDHADFSGPLAGLVAAASAVDDPWLFATACDMPLLDPDLVEWLLAHRDGADAVVPERESGIEPLCALYRREAILAARKRLPTEGGVRSVLSELAVTAVDADDCAVDLTRSVTNVNTVADLERVRESVESDSSVSSRFR